MYVVLLKFEFLPIPKFKYQPFNEYLAVLYGPFCNIFVLQEIEIAVQLIAERHPFFVMLLLYIVCTMKFVFAVVIERLLILLLLQYLVISDTTADRRGQYDQYKAMYKTVLAVKYCKQIRFGGISRYMMMVVMM